MVLSISVYSCRSFDQQQTWCMLWLSHSNFVARCYLLVFKVVFFFCVVRKFLQKVRSLLMKTISTDRLICLSSRWLSSLFKECSLLFFSFSSLSVCFCKHDLWNRTSLDLCCRLMESMLLRLYLDLQLLFEDIECRGNQGYWLLSSWCPRPFWLSKIQNLNLEYFSWTRWSWRWYSRWRGFLFIRRWEDSCWACSSKWKRLPYRQGPAILQQFWWFK